MNDHGSPYPKFLKWGHCGRFPLRNSLSGWIWICLLQICAMIWTCSTSKIPRNRKNPNCLSCQKTSNFWSFCSSISSSLAFKTPASISMSYCWWFRNPANQLRLVVHPILYRVFLHPRWLAGFLPSTVSFAATATCDSTLSLEDSASVRPEACLDVRSSHHLPGWWAAAVLAPGGTKEIEWCLRIFLSSTPGISNIQL